MVANGCSGAGVYVCKPRYSPDNVIDAEDEGAAGAGKTVLT